jgi:hypothetical protein
MSRPSYIRHISSCHKPPKPKNHPFVKGIGIKRNGGAEVIENLELQPGNILVKVVKVADHFYL